MMKSATEMHTFYYVELQLLKNDLELSSLCQFEQYFMSQTHC